MTTLYADLYGGSLPPTGTAHPVQSINVAVNAEVCGRSQESSRYSLQVFLTTRPDLWARPYRDAMVAQAGSLAEYCRFVNEPVVVSENSLMWLARLALKINPNVTPDGLGQFLGACRVAMVLVFGFALLQTGAPILFTAASVLVACAILRAVEIRDTIYPFTLTLALLVAAIFGMARASRRVGSSNGALWTAMFVAGIAAAFSASMRTIMLPVSAAMFAVFIFAIWRGRAPVRARARIAGAVAAFAIGFAAYNRVFVGTLQREDDPNVPNYTYHTVAHQLVLGLAVPENDFSRREGIQWNDEVGFALARRAMPDVTYLGPKYEAALLQYYRGLWRDHPGEMTRVYFGKLRSAGSEVFLSAAIVGRQFAIPEAIGQWLHRVTNGIVLFALAAAAFGAGLYGHLRRRDSTALMLSLLSLAALASLAESFVMYSLFVAMYFSTLLFFVFFVALTAVQAAIDAVAAAFTRRYA